MSLVDHEYQLLIYPYEAFYQGYDVIKYLYPFLIAISNYLDCSMQELAQKREQVLKQNSYKIM